LSLKFRNLCKF